MSIYVPRAQAGDLVLSAPGTMVHLSPAFTPAHLKGIVIHPEDPFKFDFIIHRGDTSLTDALKREQYNKLVKYFLASLAVPDEDQWVNLSPYEKDRIIKDGFGKTVMGRDLLAQDYLLKQITASLIYPQDKLGKTFWDKVYKESQEKYGTTNVPVNTFNKVWILPDDALIYEKVNTAYVLKNHLRVLLEEDYLSLQKHSGIATDNDKIHTIASQIVRDIVLPELQREVNEGQNFAPLRQVYSGMLLATWFKRTLKQSVLGQVYVNRGKVKGVDQVPIINEEIYQQYLKAYRKGVFNFIKEDTDSLTKATLLRRYFSGGTGSIEMAERNFGTVVLKTTTNTEIGDKAMAAGLPGDDMAQIVLVNNRATGKVQLNELSKPVKEALGLPDAAMINRTTSSYIGRRHVLMGALGMAAAAGMVHFVLFPYLDAQGLWDDRKVLSDSQKWNKFVEMLQKAKAEPIIHSNPIYRDAIDAVERASRNGLYDLEGAYFGYARYHLNGSHYQAQVGFNLDLLGRLINSSKHLYREAAFGILLKEGAGVLQVERNPDRRIEFNKLRGREDRLSDEEAKRYIAMYVEDEALGFRMEIGYLLETVSGDAPERLKEYTAVQRFSEASQREAEADIAAVLRKNVYILKARLFDRYNGSLTGSRYLRYLIYIGIVRNQIGKEFINGFENRHAFQDLGRYDFSGIEPLHFLEDPQYYGDKAQTADDRKLGLFKFLADPSYKFSEPDRAEIVESAEAKGGIDLNAANLSLSIKRDGAGMPLPLAQQDLAQLAGIDGLNPVILSIKPASQAVLFADLKAHP